LNNRIVPMNTRRPQASTPRMQRISIHTERWHNERWRTCYQYERN